MLRDQRAEIGQRDDGIRRGRDDRAEAGAVAAPAGLIVAVRSAITVPAPNAPTTASAMALRLNVFTCIEFSLAMGSRPGFTSPVAAQGRSEDLRET